MTGGSFSNRRDAALPVADEQGGAGRTRWLPGKQEEEFVAKTWFKSSVSAEHVGLTPYKIIVKTKETRFLFFPPQRCL